jgi:hypothetical protein
MPPPSILSSKESSMFRSTEWINIGSVRMVIALVAIILFIAEPARATESFNGHRFLKLCVVTESDYQSEQRFAACESFVSEVRELLSYHKIHGYSACIPKGVPNIQLVIAGIARMQSRPAQHDMEAHTILAQAFAQRWPCNS